MPNIQSANAKEGTEKSVQYKIQSKIAQTNLIIWLHLSALLLSSPVPRHVFARFGSLYVRRIANSFGANSNSYQEYFLFGSYRFENVIGSRKSERHSKLISKRQRNKKIWKAIKLTRFLFLFCVILSLATKCHHLTRAIGGHTHTHTKSNKADWTRTPTKPTVWRNDCVVAMITIKAPKKGRTKIMIIA